MCDKHLERNDYVYTYHVEESNTEYLSMKFGGKNASVGGVKTGGVE